MPNQLKVGSLKLTPSSGYIGFYPSFQASPDVTVTDQSGKGNNATFGANQTATAAWGTADRFTTAEDVSGTVALGAYLTPASSGSAGFVWAPATESLVIAFRMTMTAPAGSRPIFGTSNGTPNLGFRLFVKSTGKLNYALHSATSDFIYNDSTASVADGSLHSVCVCFDAVQQRITAYIDGAADSGFSNPSVSARTDFYPFTRRCVFNGSGQGAATHITAAMNMFGLHILKRTGGLPTNMAEIALRLHTNAAVPLNDKEWVV